MIWIQLIGMLVSIVASIVVIVSFWGVALDKVRRRMR